MWRMAGRHVLRQRLGRAATDLCWLVVVLGPIGCNKSVVSGQYFCSTDSDCRWGWVCQRTVGSGSGRCYSRAAGTPQLCAGTAPSCAHQRGVCSQSVQPCGGAAGWLACAAADYRAEAAARGLLWEATETACDGQDNDCDGVVDEGAACCTPRCDTKDCGDDDGCGHACRTGLCGAHASCVDGSCICDALSCGELCCSADQLCVSQQCCTPSCGARACGPDPACGTSCGRCSEQRLCGSDGSCGGGPLLLTFGGPGEDVPLALAVAGAADTIVVGAFSQTVALGDATLVSAGEQDAFVVRFNAGGAVSWARAYGGAGADRASGVAVDVATGDIVVSGVFSGAVDLGSHRLVAAGGADAFVARLSPRGEVRWAAAAGGPGNERMVRVAVDPAGHIILAGTFEQTAAFGPKVLTARGGADAFVAGMNGDGDFAWAVGLGGSGDDGAHAVAVNGNGNACVVGHFEGSARFADHSLTSVGASDLFAAGMISAGEVTWAFGGGSVAADAGDAVAADAQGNCYVAGTIGAPATFGRVFLEVDAQVTQSAAAVELSPTGQMAWAWSPGSYTNYGGLTVAVDRTSNLYLGLVYRYWTKASGVWEMEPPIARSFMRTALGTWQEGWAAEHSAEAINGLALDSAGNIHVAGTFAGSLVLGATSVSSRGDHDVFVRVLGPS